MIIQEKKWVSIDLKAARVNGIKEVGDKLPKPVLYILAIDNKGFIKVSFLPYKVL